MIQHITYLKYTLSTFAKFKIGLNDCKMTYEHLTQQLKKSEIILGIILIAMLDLYWLNSTPKNTVETATASPTLPPSPGLKLLEQNYIIKSGDTLEAIFNKKQFRISELYEILRADEPYLALDILRSGDQLTFLYDTKNQLQSLSLAVDQSKTVVA